MNEIEQQIEEKALNLVNSSKDNKVNEVIATEIQKSENVKDIIDLFATQTALNQQETLEKVVTEKEEELRNDAEAKRVVAETNRISKETERVKQEKEKELAELDKTISAKQKEVEQLKAESDKAQAFFDSNKDILSYIGLSSKKTLKIMYFLMIPAIIIFSIVQIIALPLTIGGKLLETEKFRARFLEHAITTYLDDTAFCVYKKTGTGYQRLNAAEKGVEEYYCVYLRVSPSNTDILNPEVVEAFINETHEQYYKRFQDSFGR